MQGEVTKISCEASSDRLFAGIDDLHDTNAIRLDVHESVKVRLEAVNVPELLTFGHWPDLRRRFRAQRRELESRGVYRGFNARDCASAEIEENRRSLVCTKVIGRLSG